MTHHRLLGLLEALSDEEFEKFQWSLRYNSDGKVTKAQLDGVNRMTTVDVMIQTCTADGAVKITQSTLETIQRNDLVGKHPDAGSGPGSAKQKTGYELAKEPAAKKPALKKAVVKDHKTATKQAPKKPTSTNKAPAKKEAQPKEVKPRKAISKKKNVINVDKSVGEKTALETATKEAPKKPTSTNKAPAKKKAHPKEAKPRKVISKKKMDLKTAPEGPREPHKKLHPKKRRKKERFQVLSATDKRGRKKKDPNAPKRPLSPFFLFCHERRPFVKEQQPGLSLVDCAKKLGQMWTQLSQYYKQPYEKKAQELREKYDTDMVAYRKISQGGNEDNDKEGDDDDVQENDDKNANRNMFCVGNPSTVTPTSHFGGAHSADASQLERTWFNSHLGGFDSIFGPFGH